MTRHDVAVFGGGPAGVMAALAAARGGARTLLVERYGFLGGQSVSSLVTPWMAFHSFTRQAVRGIPQELVERLMALGGCPGHLPDPLGVAATLTPFDTELTKLVLLRMAAEAKVELLLYTFAFGVERQGERVLRVRVAHKGGEEWIEASHFIDATGDADLAHHAGLQTRSGRESDGLHQPLTAIFKVGGVDVEALERHVVDHPGEFVLDPRYLRGGMPAIAISGFFDAVSAAREAGRFPIARDRILLFGLPRRGEVAVNTTRIQRVDPVDPRSLSLAEVEAAGQILAVHRLLVDAIPGFARSFILQTPVQTGIRESRRIVGLYELCAADLAAGRDFEDSIARGAFPIDIHSPDRTGVDCESGKRQSDYGIPLRCLIPKEAANLLVVGRALSATFEAHASARITPTAMATGQAAGTAALVALAARCDLREADPRLVRERLLRDGAVV
ncbi:MAG: FAD-dependent oxidoreductase [Candidatus Wallbacteria bacterium]|nr:FAD-dependent oxidoreductase [Candidatus Wallbacteria bacterium]